MTVLETVAVAFSMFSALPMPRVEWNGRNMRYALCAFPLVGAVIGLVCGLWVWLCAGLGLPGLLRGAGLCLAPVLITGGIHLDGYADTCDARASHAGPDRRQEIMKDPHMGAFAAIRLCGYFVATWALWTALPEYDAVAVGLAFCLSRALSGLAVTRFPLAKNTGLAHTFATAADKKRAGIGLEVLAALLCAGLCCCGLHGVLMAAAALCVMGYYHHMAVKEFGGLSGDLAGWFLQTAELWMLGAFCLAEYVEALL